MGCEPPDAGFTCAGAGWLAGALPGCAIGAFAWGAGATWPPEAKWFPPTRFIAVTVVVRRGTGKPAAPVHLQSRGFSEDPKALESVARKVEEELESLAANKVTEVARIAQGVRRVVGKWVGETYRRQPMIVPTVIEI